MSKLSTIQKTPQEEGPSLISEQAWKTIKHLASGAVSGGIARTCTAPFERAIILKQTQNGKYANLRLWQFFTTMYKEGWRSFFNGNGINVARIMPFTAIEFFAFDLYKKAFNEKLPSVNQKFSYFLAGAGAGATAAAIVYPLDLVRTLFAFQTDNKNGVHKTAYGSLKNIYHQHGIKGLYRGFGATLLGMTPYASLKLAFFQLIKNAFQSKEKPSDLVNLAAGAVAGCAAVSVTYPTDLIRRRLQILVMKENISASYIQVLKQIYTKEGFFAFYNGLGVTYLKLIPSTAITFMLNERLKSMLNVY